MACDSGDHSDPSALRPRQSSPAYTVKVSQSAALPRRSRPQRSKQLLHPLVEPTSSLGGTRLFANSLCGRLFPRPRSLGSPQLAPHHSSLPLAAVWSSLRSHSHIVSGPLRRATLSRRRHPAGGDAHLAETRRLILVLLPVHAVAGRVPFEVLHHGEVVCASAGAKRRVTAEWERRDGRSGSEETGVG